MARESMLKSHISENAYGQAGLGNLRRDYGEDARVDQLIRQVQIMSTLPLKAVSRIWGQFNELPIPFYLRVPGFKIYSWIFSVKFALH